MIKTILLREVMVTQVITVRETDPLSLVEEEMREHAIRHIPVVNDKEQLVGMITQRDLFRNSSPHKTEQGFVYNKDEINTFILKYIMTKDPVSLTPETPLWQAIGIMAENKFGCVPIVHEDRTLAGIITQIDVLKLIYKTLKNT